MMEGVSVMQLSGSSSAFSGSDEAARVDTNSSDTNSENKQPAHPQKPQSALSQRSNKQPVESDAVRRRRQRNARVKRTSRMHSGALLSVIQSLCDIPAVATMEATLAGAVEHIKKLEDEAKQLAEECERKRKDSAVVKLLAKSDFSDMFLNAALPTAIISVQGNFLDVNVKWSETAFMQPRDFIYTYPSLFSTAHSLEELMEFFQHVATAPRFMGKYIRHTCRTVVQRDPISGGMIQWESESLSWPAELPNGAPCFNSVIISLTLLPVLPTPTQQWATAVSH